jgi:predicted metal-dependent hydrolase
MPGKIFELGEGLAVTVYKRRGNRNLRLTIGANGMVRVSIPAWAPYKAGVDFAQGRRDWIREQTRATAPLTQGQAIGKAHHLKFEAVSAAKTTSRLISSTILIRYPEGLHLTDPAVQKVAHTACLRALRSQAEQLLPQRLAALAERHRFQYNSVAIKQLKGRWGSCDQQQHIVLNLYLMQLPWELIDYVLLHELTHTEILRHGPDFWATMERVLPDAKGYRKRMHTHQPILG